MGSAQSRHLPRRMSQERIGTLSYQRIARLQRGQRLPGETTLSPLGTLAMTTFKKLPMTAPSAKTQIANASVMPFASSSIKRLLPCRARARRTAPRAIAGGESGDYGRARVQRGLERFLRFRFLGEGE